MAHVLPTGLQDKPLHHKVMTKPGTRTPQDAPPSFHRRCGLRRAGKDLLLTGSILCLLLGPAPTALASAYSDAVLADNPLVYYQLNEASGTTAANSAATGSTYDGTYNNVTLNAAGPSSFLDKAAVLDGTTSSITLPALTNGLTAITIELWLNCASFTADNANCIYMTDGWQPGSLHYQFAPPNWTGNMPLGTAAFGAYTGSGGAYSPAVAPGQWHHLVVTSGAGSTTFFLDGVAAAPSAETIMANLVQAHIGAWGGNDRHLQGSVSQFSLYNKALSASHVIAHYNAGIAGTATPNHTITATAPTGATISPSGSVAVLDGESQTFVIAGSMDFNITGLEVDGVSQSPQASYTFDTVTDNHTITVVGAAATTTITGNVSPLSSGQEAAITATNTATLQSVITTTVSGAYSITAGDGTYTLTAKAPGLLYAAAQEATVAGVDIAHDIALVDTPLVDVQAINLTPGAANSAPNAGTLGGNFVATGPNPSVGVVAGYQTLEFNQTPMQLRDSGGAAIAPPQQIVGSPSATPKYTVSGWLYRQSYPASGDNAGWLSWSAPYKTAWFHYGPEWMCLDNWESGYPSLDYWPKGCPPAAAWYHFCITCSGSSVTLWIYNSDGSLYLTKTQSGSGYLTPDSFYIGEEYPGWPNWGFPFVGCIASLQIWPFGITPDDVAAVQAYGQPRAPISAGSYSDWQAAHFSAAQITAGLADPGADADGDAMTNFQEFAFGLNPTSGSSVNPISVPFNMATGKFSYTQTVSSGLVYTVWTSTDLKDWAQDSEATASQAVTGAVGAIQTVEVTVTAAPPNGKLFVRVKAQ